MGTGRWHLYILECADHTLYTGTTTDLTRRLREHNAGRGGAYTRQRCPVRLVHEERYASRAAAQRREAALKGLPRRRKLALIDRET